MRRAPFAAVTLAVAAAAATGALAPPDEKLAMVTIVADQGKAVSGLTPADFAITEDKDKVDVIEAIPAKDPLSVVVLVDTALPADGSAATPELRKGLTAFVSTVLAGEPGAQIALYKVANAAIPVKDFMSSPAGLEDGINLITSGTSGGSAMLEGVVIAANRIAERPAPRRAIVCIGIGTAEGTALHPKEVGDLVRKSGATLWVVSVQASTDAALTNRDTVWTRATEDTGGLRQNVVQATRLEGRMQSVANSLLSQYVVKIVRKKDGAVKGFKGKTAQGAQVLFTRWVR
jgi:hypothetical protein